MTKWKIKKCDDIDGKPDFEWEQWDGKKDAKWDWDKIMSEVKSMEIGEERIIEV